MNDWQGSRLQAELIFASYAKLFAEPLLDLQASDDLLEKIYFADFAILSHGVEIDPVFNFANKFALDKFELNWSEMQNLPSRFSAEAPNREERKELLDRVTRFGFINDYQGVRISSTGKRFLIKEAIVWNLVDDKGDYQGQAAAFSKCEDLS
jgi:hypothetical protein